MTLQSDRPRNLTQYIYNSKVVSYSITSVGLGADTGFLAVNPQVTLAINSLPLLSTKPAVTFTAKEITPLGRYQIILLGDRGTQV